MNTQRMTIIGTAATIACLMAATAQSQVRISGATTTMTLQNRIALSAEGIDFAHAKPMPLPAARALPPSARAAISRAVDPLLLFGPPGGAPGGVGDGRENPIQLVAPQKIPSRAGVEPDEFGTSNQPFTTSEVNAYNDGTYKYYPFRAAGKLFFKIGTSSYLCSASLIKPGIAVTAAHCVANYGNSQFYSNWTYVPAYNNGTAPYGTWNAASARVLTAYYRGTDGCAQYGVICPDDVALLTLTPSNGRYPGTTTGWFGYGYNGYDYNGSSQVQLAQLGYPVDLDGGLLMQRNDSQGFVNTGFSNNTIIGSLMTGGSSGGPWVVNLGLPPTLSGGDTFGTYASHNTVVGVTSWGYTDLTIKQQGAAPFTSNNISVLVNADCTATPGAC